MFLEFPFFLLESQSTVVLISKETHIVTYLVKCNILSWSDGHLKCCNTHESLDPERYLLEVSKKVKNDLVPQGASQL